VPLSPRVLKRDRSDGANGSSPEGEPERAPQSKTAMLAPIVAQTREVATLGVEAVQRVDWEGLLRRAGAAFLALVAALVGLVAAAVGWLARSLVPLAARTAPLLDRLAHFLWRGLYQLWHAMKRVTQQVLPGNRPAPLVQLDRIPPPPGDGSAFLRTLAILLPLLLVVVVGVVAWTLRDDELERAAQAAPATATGNYVTLVNEAQDLIAQAQNVDEQTAQRLLLEADRLLIQAEPLEAEAGQVGRVAELRQQASALLDQAGAISRPASGALAVMGAGNRPVSIVQGGDSVFVLEQARSAVYRVFDNPSATVVLNEIAPLLSAQQRMAEGVVAGTPRAITWIPAGGGRRHDGPVILTTEGQLFDFDVNSNLFRLPAFSPVQAEIQTLGGYGGNLYLLDRTNRQIWRYTPDGAGQYSTPPGPWLLESGQQRFGEPVDMAIDGFIYLLDRSGQVTRFQVGQPRPFALEPVTPPLAQPVAMAKAPPESTDMFIAEAQRVVRFDDEGRFLAEYRAPLGQDWGTIIDIAVSANSEVLYVLGTTGVYRVPVTS
jgi:hypothetical protein